MPASLKIGKIGGIEVSIHWSWLFIFILITWSFATGILDHFYPGWSAAQRWLVGAIVSLVFFLSLLMHELAHSLLARRPNILAVATHRYGHTPVAPAMPAWRG